ncbi:hypothetical protein BDR05DRAFT_583766 [Suillus weaverae]|nr:hypothetical protein BDR05DRAFT_583766 [Suillus weaverae]
MGFGGGIGANPESVVKASNSSSSRLHIASRGAGERIRARARGAEGLSCGLDLAEVDDEGIEVDSVEDVEKYGEVVDARLFGADGGLSEEVGLEDETRVDEVEVGIELDFEAARAKLGFGAAVDKGFDRTAGGAALVDVEPLGGLPADCLLATGGVGTLGGRGACSGASASSGRCGFGSGSACLRGIN